MVWIPKVLCIVRVPITILLQAALVLSQCWYEYCYFYTLLYNIIVVTLTTLYIYCNIIDTNESTLRFLIHYTSINSKIVYCTLYYNSINTNSTVLELHSFLYNIHLTYWGIVQEDDKCPRFEPSGILFVWSLFGKIKPLSLLHPAPPPLPSVCNIYYFMVPAKQSWQLFRHPQTSWLKLYVSCSISRLPLVRV